MAAKDKMVEAIMDQAKGPALTLTSAQLAQLGGYLGVSIRGPEDLLREVSNMSKMSVEGVEVSLQPELLRRFLSRNFGGKPVGKYVQEEISRMVGEFAGW